jgi:hypothetical protein
MKTCRIEGPAHMLFRFGVDGVIVTDIVSTPEYNNFHHSDAFRRSAACNFTLICAIEYFCNVFLFS